MSASSKKMLIQDSSSVVQSAVSYLTEVFSVHFTRQSMSSGWSTRRINSLDKKVAAALDWTPDNICQYTGLLVAFIRIVELSLACLSFRRTRQWGPASTNKMISCATPVVHIIKILTIFHLATLIVDETVMYIIVKNGSAANQRLPGRGSWPSVGEFEPSIFTPKRHNFILLATAGASWQFYQISWKSLIIWISPYPLSLQITGIGFSGLVQKVYCSWPVPIFNMVHVAET